MNNNNNKMAITQKLTITILLLICSVFFSCSKYKTTSSKDVPTNALERARKNVDEGRGVSVGGLFKKNNNTNYQFSTSNPMWRATLEILDFLPLSVVDYSGGVVITDWYNNDVNSSESLKITLRFLSNEIRPDSLKITIHKKKCSTDLKCTVAILNSKIKDELRSSIVKKAATLNAKLKK